MTITFYKSTDASAPSLTGQVGSLVALLDAILVNGYGSQPAAGWTTAFTATNKRDYKQGTGSNGYYLDIDDSGPGGGAAREARMRGYETMSALATGTQAFPTSAQSSFGVICRKSNTADSTARPWYAVADATCFYLFVDTGDYSAPNYSMAFHFGDFFSYKSGDTYNTSIIGRSTENSANDGAEALPMLNPPTTLLTAAANGHWVDRVWTGTGGSIAFGKHTGALAYGNVYNGNASPCCMGAGASMGTYPNGPDGALELSPVWIGHSGSVRGYLKGLWCSGHYQPTGHGDTFSGTGNMSGKSFLSLNMRTSNYAGVNNVGGNNTGQIVIETSNTWS